MEGLSKSEEMPMNNENWETTEKVSSGGVGKKELGAPSEG